MDPRLLIALGLVAAGYWWGHTATDNAWAARQAKTDQAAAKELAAETRRADVAGGNYLQEHLDQEDRYADLDARYTQLQQRAPLIVYRRAPATSAGPAGPAGPAPRGSVPVSVADAPVPALTMAAVRMWNGALAGTDAQAGACGAAGSAEDADAACAEDSGLDIADAWANHRVNAKACADDRQRYRALINYLNQSPQ
ncbi:hypothetical protein SAMN05192589_107131 [Paracidovorax valerianellae]|uniref:Uncharacterized protein n=1 Tax=Paracidovorax valerianellae TaxID=187868 RepID=A0A1G6VTJ9_9BURK|nr:hypothetical protein [Paracidovorax valerianellae]SDD56753.1 hypothetical protein SAMN05192589_107131 [Paracidovorax valerianellae]